MRLKEESTHVVACKQATQHMPKMQLKKRVRSPLAISHEQNRCQACQPNPSTCLKRSTAEVVRVRRTALLRSTAAELPKAICPTPTGARHLFTGRSALARKQPVSL